MKTRTALFLLCVLILAACTPAATTTSTVPPPATQAAEATESPAAEAPTFIPTPTPSLQVGDTYLHMDGTNLVAVPAGEFTMGGEGSDNPAHPVTLSDYWIYSTKVTNQQFALCVNLGKCTPPDTIDNHNYSEIQHANDPVTGITYDQAVVYCSFVNGRLPTEAEWEKAAGNPQGGNYPWGDQPPTCDLANFGDCAEGMTNVVNHSGGASYYGTLDMLGNAFEWVADWYDAGYYNNSPTDDPTGPESGTLRVVRSSGINTSQDQLSVFTRNSEDPNTHRTDIGFRCVVDQPDQFAPLCELPLVYETDAATSTCPTLELKQVELCAKNFPYTNVSISGATDLTIQSEGCVETDDPATVSCQPPSTVSASAQCQVEISGDATCLKGFTLQNNTCVADGAGGACPASLNFDSSKQCCGLPASADAVTRLSVCPVGTFYAAGQNACLPSPVQELVTVMSEVEFKACGARPNSGGGGEEEGGGGGGCQPPQFGCFSSDWSPSLCCCTVNGTTCDF